MHKEADVLYTDHWQINIIIVHNWYSIARTWHQPNYPNQLASKRGSQSSLMFDPNPMRRANGGNLSIVQAGDTLISPLFSPAFDHTFDHLQPIRAALIFKMQKDL